MVKKGPERVTSIQNVKPLLIKIYEHKKGGPKSFPFFFLSEPERPYKPNRHATLFSGLTPRTMKIGLDDG